MLCSIYQRSYRGCGFAKREIEKTESRKLVKNNFSCNEIFTNKWYRKELMKHPSLKEQPFLEEERRNLMDETPLMLELRHLTDSKNVAILLHCYVK